MNSHPLTGINIVLVEWIGRNNFCWFCIDELNKDHNTHHILPRRYFKDKQTAGRDNTVKVCRCCHERWNREYDNPQLSQRQYVQSMQSVDWGFGIYVSDD